MAGEYTPKYKVGYTICPINDETTLYIVVGTYRGLGQFSSDYANGHIDYDERDADHVLYALFHPETLGFAWRWENLITLYCCNPNHGKKILLELNSLKQLSDLYSLRGEGLSKFIAMLNDQST